MSRTSITQMVVLSFSFNGVHTAKLYIPLFSSKILYTDFLSASQSLHGHTPDHSAVVETQCIVSELRQRSQIVFCWLTGHIGLPKKAANVFVKDTLYMGISNLWEFYAVTFMLVFFTPLLFSLSKMGSHRATYSEM
jgi:hypothetical protein